MKRPLILAAFLAASAAGLREAGTAPPNRGPVVTVSSLVAVPVDEPLPEWLSETGLYAARSTSEPAPGLLFYVPQYPLWSDGATKRRWVSLPSGTRIDASNPDAWVFPVGTRFWKEFSFGERTETRYLERVRDGSYRYATYVWDAARGDARRAPESGVRGVRSISGAVRHDVPSEDDCRACHEGKTSPVLGFGALQLSSDRDPFAPHREAVPAESVDLASLAARDLIFGLPAALLATPPRIAAATPAARAVAGYLYGNCSGCHNAEGPLASVGLDFDQSVLWSDGGARLFANVAQRPSRFTLPGDAESKRVVPGKPEQSALWFRVGSRESASQMPPLGTKLPDAEALRLVQDWIFTLARSSTPKETVP